jgi:hypothetical protein
VLALEFRWLLYILDLVVKVAGPCFHLNMTIILIDGWRGWGR